MNRIVSASIAVSVWILAAVQPVNCEEPPTPEQVIRKMEAAVDPEGTGKNVKTLVTVVNTIIPDLGLELKTTVRDKFPDRTRVERDFAGYGKVLRVLADGQGWEFTPQTGLREIVDMELELMKFELFVKNPAVSMTEAFRDLAIVDDGYIIGGKAHIVISGVPNTKAGLGPWRFFIDRETFLPSRIEASIDTPAGARVKATTIIEEYGKVNGRNVPVRTRLLHEGMELISTLDSVKENVELDEGEFVPVLR